MLGDRQAGKRLGGGLHEVEVVGQLLLGQLAVTVAVGGGKKSAVKLLRPALLHVLRGEEALVAFVERLEVLHEELAQPRDLTQPRVIGFGGAPFELHAQVAERQTDHAQGHLLDRERRLVRIAGQRLDRGLIVLELAQPDDHHAVSRHRQPGGQFRGVEDAVVVRVELRKQVVGQTDRRARQHTVAFLVVAGEDGLGGAESSGGIRRDEHQRPGGRLRRLWRHDYLDTPPGKRRVADQLLRRDHFVVVLVEAVQRLLSPRQLRHGQLAVAVGVEGAENNVAGPCRYVAGLVAVGQLHGAKAGAAVVGEEFFERHLAVAVGV